MILHNTLAVASDRVPLGLIDQTFVDRKAFAGKDFDEKRKIRHWNRPIEEKESRRWIDVVRKCHDLDFDQTQTIHVADLECDFYEFFRDAAELGENVLVRAAKNRSINKNNRREPPSALLFDYLKAKKAQGKTTVTIQVNGKKKFRDTELSIIYRPITMPPPPNKTVKKDGPNLPIVPLLAIMAIERKPPKKEAGLFWVLLTNSEVNSIDQAIEKVR